MQATVAMNNKQAKKAAAVEATQGSKTEEFKLQDFQEKEPELPTSKTIADLEAQKEALEKQLKEVRANSKAVTISEQGRALTNSLDAHKSIPGMRVSGDHGGNTLNGSDIERLS